MAYLLKVCTARALRLHRATTLNRWKFRASNPLNPFHMVGQ